MIDQTTSEFDVCYILEGTYPYVSGGVSTWIHQAIAYMPDLTFAIHYIGAESKTRGKRKYDVPENVRSIEEVFIFDDEECPAKNPPVLTPAEESDLNEAFEIFLDLFDENAKTIPGDFIRSIRIFRKIADRLPFEVFWSHPVTWDFTREVYRRKYPEESFVSFFWNSKFIVKPIWELLRSFSRIPKAKVYHSVGTGYAGFLTGVAKFEHQRAYLLSEHGIYVRERITDLLRSEWTPALTSDFARTPGGISLLRQTWIDFFIYLGNFCYESSDHITSLFDRNAEFQVEFGANREQIEIIPNGIKPERFESIEKKRDALRKESPDRKTVGFLGRIVSIKDVRSLIRAAKLTCDNLPDSDFLLVGPTDEDEEYYEGCQKLIKELGLEKRVKLTGKMSLDEALPLFDVMALSSISEGLPFAVLESFAARIPVVSTDVGACGELIYGPKNSTELPGGIVVPVADHPALANALTTLLRDRKLQDEYGSNGKDRVDRKYLESDVMDRFRSHYTELGKQPVPGKPFNLTV